MSEEKKKPAAPKKEKEVKADTAAAAPAVAEAKPAKKEKAAVAAAPAVAAPAEPAAPVVPTAADLLGEDPNAKKIVKAKHAKNISSGIANILATFNNTQVTITDMQRKWWLRTPLARRWRTA
jgi:small subunit ribosomal protein S11